MSFTGSKSFWKASGGAAGILILLAILVAVNVIVSNMRARVDLTEENLYTLSDGTRNVLKELERKVTLKLFFSSSDPAVPMQLKSYADQVTDLLQEYRKTSGNKVKVEQYDPKPDSDAEEWAQKYGIQGQQLGLMGPAIYFGLVVVAGDAEELVPALDPRTQQMLEYNLTRTIYRVTHPQKPVIGVLSSLPVLGQQQPPMMPGQPPAQSQPWMSFADLRRDYDLREVDAGVDTISEEISALVLVHPKGLSPKTLFAIDQFVLKGGRLMVFVDPLCIADLESQPQASPYQRPSTSSDLPDLFRAWGVGYNAADVVADMSAATRVRGAGNRVEDSLVWLSLGRSHINRDDILTTQLENVLLPFAGSFTDLTSDDVTFTPLMNSSTESGTVNAMSAQSGGDAMRRQFRKGATALPLAVRLNGTFKTAFPDGAPKDTDAPDKQETDQGATTEEEATSLQSGESAIILVADADMLVDRFCVQEVNFFGTRGHQPINDNLNLLANAVEQVGGSSDLIGIRSRGTFNRPFDRVMALEQKARNEWQAREQELTRSLQEAQQQLREMQNQKESSQRFILSPQQQAAIAQFRQRELEIKKELKEVRKNLRRDIEMLGIKVKTINIALMPLLVALGGVGYGLARRKKR
ncbi:MAG: Gldg family protein [Kiritimatiellae bacterium]|nr:Gldg family protein [Kiritimatiellia bacterium]